MLEENNNLKSHIKDTSRNMFIKDERMPAPYESEGFRLVSYTKTNKLISALYMVTDIMDTEEPIRHKLRKSGANIISDIHSLDKGQSLYSRINERVSEILSFLEVASSVGIISEMNCKILTKEFIELKESIIKTELKNEQNWLEEFIKEDEQIETKFIGSRAISIGQKIMPTTSVQKGTRIGVQKGSTLLKALSDITSQSDRNINSDKRTSNEIKKVTLKNNGEVINKRREEIISIIKDKMKNSPNFEGVTITDIKSIGQNSPNDGGAGALVSCGEKTLQRELVSMVSNGILQKTGEKRWSRYSIKN